MTTSSPKRMPDRSRLTWTVPEAGQVIGISRDAAYRFARENRIPTIKVGGVIRVPVRKFLKSIECDE